MKILYAARLARFDLLRAVCHIACFVTKWTSDCDKRLHRLVSYISSSKSYRMVGWVGDPIQNLDLHLLLRNTALNVWAAVADAGSAFVLPPGRC